MTPWPASTNCAWAASWASCCRRPCPNLRTVWPMMPPHRGDLRACEKATCEAGTLPRARHGVPRLTCRWHALVSRLSRTPRRSRATHPSRPAFAARQVGAATNPRHSIASNQHIPRALHGRLGPWSWATRQRLGIFIHGLSPRRQGKPGPADSKQRRCTVVLPRGEVVGLTFGKIKRLGRQLILVHGDCRNERCVLKHPPRSSGHRRGKLGVQIARKLVSQSPLDRHRPLPLMRHIVRRTEQPERAVILGETSEQERMAGLPIVVAIPQPGIAVLACGGLAFPMNELAIDGVITVTGGRRKLTVGLVEGKGQQIGTFVRQPANAFAPGG